MPVWFKPLVNKVIKEGDDVTKKFATADREIVHTKKLGKGEFADDVTVYQDLNTGNVRVEYHAGSNMGEAPIQLDYKAGEIIQQGSKKGTKTKPEFSAVESEPRVTNWDGDIEFDGENIVSKVDDLLTDTTKLETYATGNKPNIKKLLKSEQKQKQVNKLNDDQMEQLDYIENKTGHMAPEGLLDEMPDDIPYASGGRVPMWLGGGLSAGKRTLSELLKYMSKGSSHGKTPSEMLKMINPKQFNEMLDRPEGIPSIAKEMIEKYTKEIKIDRANMIEDLIGTGRRMKKVDDDLVNYKIKIIEDMVSKGVDRKTAKEMAENLAEMVSQGAGKKATPKITEQGLLEMENIQKNLATKDRKLNATGGRASLSAGGLAGMLGE